MSAARGRALQRVRILRAAYAIRTLGAVVYPQRLIRERHRRRAMPLDLSLGGAPTILASSCSANSCDGADQPSGVAVRITSASSPAAAIMVAIVRLAEIGLRAEGQETEPAD